MEEILHQLRLVVYPTIYRALCMPGGAGFQPSAVSPAINGVVGKWSKANG